MQPTARRTANYEQKMRNQGFRKVHLWVPEGRAEEIAEIAKEMREARIAERVRREIIATLRRAKPRLHKLGVEHLCLFGSFARGDARDGSDVDLVADLAPGVSILDLIEIEQVVADRLGREVDLVSRNGLDERFLSAVNEDQVEIF